MMVTQWSIAKIKVATVKWLQELDTETKAIFEEIYKDVRKQNKKEIVDFGSDENVEHEIVNWFLNA